MINNTQETASKMIIPISDDPIFHLRLHPEDQTFGRECLINFYYFSININLIENALESIKGTDNPAVSGRAREILTSIQDKIDSLLKYKIDLLSLPTIRAFNVDDGSILLEWIFNDFRVGFSIEQIESESSWHLVSNEKYGETNASGFISKNNFDNILLWLIDFIINSINPIE